MIVLTQDGVKYELSRKMYRQSIFLRHVSEEIESEDKEISILVVSSVFEKILEFMKAHKDDTEVAEEYNGFNLICNDFDNVFLEMDSLMLFQVTAAANYLYMPVLLEMCCMEIAESLKEKTTDEIKKYLMVPKESEVKNGKEVQKKYNWIE
ncbi:S-phase kinase-associated protein 1 [Nematocida sp. AWRm80]|nr:S-phase kinase-associated protein 1 [Nematocida sp. AWRm80]